MLTDIGHVELQIGNNAFHCKSITSAVEQGIPNQASASGHYTSPVHPPQIVKMIIFLFHLYL